MCPSVVVGARLYRHVGSLLIPARMPMGTRQVRPYPAIRSMRRIGPPVHPINPSSYSLAASLHCRDMRSACGGSETGIMIRLGRRGGGAAEDESIAVVVARALDRHQEPVRGVSPPPVSLSLPLCLSLCGSWYAAQWCGKRPKPQTAILSQVSGTDPDQRLPARLAGQMAQQPPPRSPPLGSLASCRRR